MCLQGFTHWNLNSPLSLSYADFTPKKKIKKVYFRLWCKLTSSNWNFLQNFSVCVNSVIMWVHDFPPFLRILDIFNCTYYVILLTYLLIPKNLVILYVYILARSSWLACSYFFLLRRRNGAFVAVWLSSDFLRIL